MNTSSLTEAVLCRTVGSSVEKQKGCYVLVWVGAWVVTVL